MYLWYNFQRNILDNLVFLEIMEEGNCVFSQSPRRLIIFPSGKIIAHDNRYITEVKNFRENKKEHIMQTYFL